MDKSLVQLFWEVPITFIVLLLMTRFQGKNTISHLTYFDYITGIVMGDMAAGALIDETIPLSRSLTALLLFGVLSILASILGLKWRKVRRFAEGEPVAIIKNGKILEKNAQKVRLDIDNLRMLLRKKDVFSTADVEFAVLETDGSLSVLKKAEKETVTLEDFKQKSNPKRNKPGMELIIDGVIDEQKIKEAKLTKKEIENILKQRKIKSISDVSYMEITGDGKIYIDLYEDHIPEK